MALRDRRGTKRLPPAGRIGLGEKVFYCKNSNCPRSKDKSPKNPIVNTKDDVVACPDCGTKYSQNQIRDFPRATDHFVFPYVPNPGVANLWVVFGDQCQDLPIIFPFPNIDDNVDAHYKIWAGGVNVCKGDGVEVCKASPMRVVGRSQLKTTAETTPQPPARRSEDRHVAGSRRRPRRTRRCCRRQHRIPANPQWGRPPRNPRS